MADLATHVQVLTTLDDRDAALALARAMVDARLVACAQVTGPVTSVYRWQGEVEQATEWYCVMKTTGARYEALAAWIAEHHPYDTPELVATPIVAGGQDYLAWITAETVPQAGDA
ncbi:MAG TPA: divalent-cation tolerance protein CutA [Euzebyales bacterium]|nr:divalent-cation tolerance protein CutA [Euzebyales bacterium]